jgi:hypothetical protein
MYNFCLFLSYEKVVVLLFAVKNFVYNEVFITKLKYDFLHLSKNHEVALALDIPCQDVYNFQNFRIRGLHIIVKIILKSHTHIRVCNDESC